MITPTPPQQSIGVSQGRSTSQRAYATPALQRSLGAALPIPATPRLGTPQSKARGGSPLDDSTTGADAGATPGSKGTSILQEPLQKAFPSQRNTQRIGKADRDAFNSFLQQSAVFNPQRGEGGEAEPNSGRPPTSPRTAALPIAHKNSPKQSRLSPSPGQSPVPGDNQRGVGSASSTRAKHQIGILTSNMTPAAMSFVKNQLIPAAVDEANEEVRRRALHESQEDGSVQLPLPAAAAVAVKKGQSPAQLSLPDLRTASDEAPALDRRDVRVAFFAKNDGDQSRGKEYVVLHGPNARGIKDAVDATSATSRKRQIRAQELQANDTKSGASPVTANSPASPPKQPNPVEGGASSPQERARRRSSLPSEARGKVTKPPAKKAEESLGSDDDSVYYTSTSDDDQGEYANRRKAKKKHRKREHQRAVQKHYKAGVIDAARKSGLVLPVPTGCGDCDYVASTLTKFNHSLARGNHKSLRYIKRHRHAEEYGGDEKAASRDEHRMTLLANQPYAVSQMGGTPLECFMSFHAMNKFVNDLTPRCALALRNAVVRYFTMGVMLEAMQSQLRAELTLHEFLSSLLHIPKSAATKGGKYEVTSCVLLENTTRVYHLRHRSLYGPQHTSQLMANPQLSEVLRAAANRQATAQAAAMPLNSPQEFNLNISNTSFATMAPPSTPAQGSLALLSPPSVSLAPLGGPPEKSSSRSTTGKQSARRPQIRVNPETMNSLMEWELLFATYDPQHTGTVNRHLFLLNILVATADADAAVKAEGPMADTLVQEPEFFGEDAIDDDDISWVAQSAVSAKDQGRRMREFNMMQHADRVNHTVAWMVAMCRQHTDAEGIRPGELFTLRDLLTAEIRQLFATSLVREKLAISQATQSKPNTPRGSSSSGIAQPPPLRLSNSRGSQRPGTSASVGSYNGALTSRSGTPSVSPRKSTTPRGTSSQSTRAVRHVANKLVAIEQALVRSAGYSQSPRRPPTVAPGGPVVPHFEDYFASQLSSEPHIAGLEKLSQSIHDMIDEGEMQPGTKVAKMLLQTFDMA